MIKIHLLLTFLSLNMVLFGQTLQKEIDLKNTTNSDTLNDLVTVHAVLSGQTSRDVENTGNAIGGIVGTLLPWSRTSIMR